MAIDPSAHIAFTARIHPDATIGPRTRVGEFCIVEQDVEIGADCLFEPYCFVKRWTTLGDGNEISAGTVLGTDPLDKNFTGERSYLRKGQEFVITYMLEFVLDKQRIFEIYLNVVEWGNGVFGAEAAAQHYYRIPAASLGAEQAARLAVMLPRPRYYDRNRGSGYLAARTSLILRRMNAATLPATHN